jgi:hypothetical protein
MGTLSDLELDRSWPKSLRLKKHLLSTKSISDVRGLEDMNLDGQMEGKTDTTATVCSPEIFLGSPCLKDHLLSTTSIMMRGLGNM